MIASDNPIFRCMYRMCWTWGCSNPLKNEEGRYAGGPAPVFRNPDRVSLIIFALVNLLILAIILILYLSESASKSAREMELPGLFIAGILFGGFNGTVR